MIIKAQKRDILGKKNKQLRKQNLIPASIYGPGIKKTLTVSLNEKDFRKLYKAVGHSKLFDYEVDGSAAKKGLLKEVQIDKLKDKVIHASIYSVDMDKEISTTVPIKFTGVSLAVKNNIGLIITQLTDIEISCLPGDLPNEIIADISNLNEIGDSIFIKDLNIGDKITLVDLTEDAVVATIAAPQKSIEEETPVEEEVGDETTEETPVEESTEEQTEE